MGCERVAGWDLGGAHLKAALIAEDGAVLEALQLPCPLWQGLHHLHQALDQALARIGEVRCHAVTMTGEMADLFESRAEGVARLADAMGARLAGGHLLFFAGRFGLVQARDAASRAQQIASANWLAAAYLVAAKLEQALFIDIGSTTTDIVLIAAGRVQAQGYGDFERLAQGELLYTGVVRTPVMALVRRVPFEGRWVPVMAELFATTVDVYRLIGLLPESADQLPAADGGEKTIAASARRLARMIGRDVESAPLGAWRELASWIAEHQLRMIEDACHAVLSRGLVDGQAPIVGAGIGRFLAQALAERLNHRPYRDFASLFDRVGTDPGWVAGCAPAVAVACLAQDRLKD